MISSKKRMFEAMRLSQPDRVPVMCQLSLGHYFLASGLEAIEIWHSSEGFAEALIRLQQRYRFDGILINLPGRDPNWSKYIKKIEKNEDKKIIYWFNGWITVCPPDDNPHVFREDGRKGQARFEEIEPEKLFYLEPHDLGGLKYPFYWGFSNEPPDPNDPSNFFPPWHYDTVKLLVDRVGHKVSIHGEVFSPFSQLLELLGYEAGFLAMKREPAKFKECLKALTRGTITYGLGLAACGVDAILISSAFAGGQFISLKHYQEFVLPYEKMVIQGIKAEYDLPIYTHTCGKIGDRLELIAETGTNGIDTLDPPPLGNVDLAEAKKRVGNRLFLKGNVDPVNIILKGTPEIVFEQATKCLAAAKEGGGYILSTACSVPPHAPPQNIMMLFAATEQFGSYL
ncbi:MAG: uroporphyrinogen decarboxylase family protein [Candidatus Aminicenantes bacterium]|nr:uroporphyrinogen decarboxylase family protein [Candidatus Aminicenantes bacterium]